MFMQIIYREMATNAALFLILILNDWATQPLLRCWLHGDFQLSYPEWNSSLVDFMKFSKNGTCDHMRSGSVFFCKKNLSSKQKLLLRPSCDLHLMLLSVFCCFFIFFIN